MKMYTLIGVLLVLLLLFAFVAYCFFRKYIKWKTECKKAITDYEELNDKYNKLLQSNVIKHENKVEADEKINNLHNGNTVDNAINILRKH